MRALFQQPEAAVGEVDVTIDSGVAVVTMDRPHARNAIGLQTISELGEALDRVTSDGAAVVVLRGRVPARQVQDRLEAPGRELMLNQPCRMVV